MHFSRLGAYSSEKAVPIIARGEGCYVWDAKGKKYLDALAGLFTVQLGHGRKDLAAAAAAQMETLEYVPIWTYAHPPAIELAARLAELAPGDLNRVFFTTGGSEAVESAWKLARQYHRVRGEGQWEQHYNCGRCWHRCSVRFRSSRSLWWLWRRRAHYGRSHLGACVCMR